MPIGGAHLAKPASSKRRKKGDIPRPFGSFAKLQKQSGKQNFGLPVQILGDYIMTGSAESEADVFKAWEEHLGVKPK